MAARGWLACVVSLPEGLGAGCLCPVGTAVLAASGSWAPSQERLCACPLFHLLSEGTREGP